MAELEVADHVRASRALAIGGCFVLSTTAGPSGVVTSAPVMSAFKRLARHAGGQALRHREACRPAQAPTSMRSTKRPAALR